MHIDTPYNELAKFYDKLFSIWNKNYKEETERLHKLIQHYKNSPDNTLLDIGCGTGEHLRFLKKYYKVTGIDQSEEMLEIAQKKLPNVQFYSQDMADFKLGHEFDIIISLFSAIGYVKTISRLNRTIACISVHLKPGGIVVVEPWFSPEEFKKHRNDVLFGQQDDFKACRMRESLIEGNEVKITEHIMISTDNHVTHFISKHEFGLFTEDDFMKAFEKNQLHAHYCEEGLTGRGLYIGVKSN